MKIRVRLDDHHARAALRRWGGELAPRVRTLVGRTLKAEATALTADVREHVTTRLAVKRRGFAKSFRARVVDRDAGRWPALHIGSAIAWAGLHETGGTVGGPLLIPLHGRIGRKRFKALITGLLRGGHAFFVRAHGRVILMAEHDPSSPLLRVAARHYRRAEGLKPLRRGQAIPIAVLVPRVTLRARLDVHRLGVMTIPRLALAIRRALQRLD